LIINILVVNNTRDIGTDTLANKRTLAVVLGRQAMLAEYLLCLIIAYLVPLGLWAFAQSSLGGLLAWLSIPQAVVVYRDFTRSNGRALNKTLAATAQLALVFALLYALGIALF
jgi:1,4-dihydroxy-2-naphthoate octaprenyltransferase